MAINIRKGTAHSLRQSDIVGNAKLNEAVVQGMICHKDSNGDIVKGTATATDEILGFAINNQTDGDVLESGKIGLYVLDGNSVVETDQVTGTVSSIAIGTEMVPDSTTGKIKASVGGDRVIGRVEGYRTLLGVDMLTVKLVS